MWYSARTCRALAGILLALSLGTTLTTEAAGKHRRTKKVVPAASRKKASKPRKPPEPAYTPEAVNAATPALPYTPASSGPDVLRVQILLDRAHFSVGELDGRWGSNTRRALAAFKKARGLSGDEMDEIAWTALARDAAPAVVPYTITPQDVAGPFYDVPEDMMEKSKLPALAYGSSLEMLAERFHMAPRLMVALNQKVSAQALPESGKELAGAAAAFRQPGTQIFVASVQRPPAGKASRVVVNAKDLSVSALDQSGNVLARYPATVGSEHDPLPDGEFKVNGVTWNPPFKYNPNLFWDAEPGDQKTMLKPGPNSPVGVVWIDLSKEHYGIHGTAEPASIGKSVSHGCIRLTNWDAQELGQMVAPGVKATLER